MTETAEVAALRAANGIRDATPEELAAAEAQAARMPSTAPARFPDHIDRAEAREAKKREERLERAEGDQPRRVRVPRPRALHQRELAEAHFLQASGKQAVQRAATARLRVQREKEQAECAGAQRAAAAAAERRELEELESLVRSILRENPFSEHASEDEEAEWRELAHASRQLLPLFEALRKADEPNSEYARYRAGFRFRLQEAQTTIAKLIQYGRIHPLRQRSFGADGGNKSGPKKKADADERWRNEALRVAQAYVATHPSATRADVIGKIRRQCAHLKLPRTPEQIGKAVDAWRRDGKIKLEQ
jgi:hypothetical protein